MSSSMVLVIVVLIAALGIAYVIGRLITLRAGMIRAGEQAADVDTSDLGLSHTGPTVLHFSAEWCGPCAGVRRVVDQVCAELPDVAHVEIDMDANPEAARRLSVLSLPTTIIFDRDGRPRYRTSGVPKAADLRSALEPLLA
ncbi:thiol reductase thioredoxin [Mycolicibacterium peregrinum]|jgi:thiol-disulfide isomerase/thioredoxin|uniref:Thioredoxin n=3 Tax=Mycolicibacterium TaxID=1866885 RepID=A0A0J8X2X4_9MYCO|nr:MULTISPECIES: thioredoxin family protein [Mycolicibacterium]KLI06379.1 thioredoxin [Mycolicibacterium senegalense]KLO53550.1 thioredoxin [Mycolicibacterium senegalense]KMV19834.1 thioredoxin [Mycolicibacterium conceptionense]MCV7201352.1 thioredoxin family protein [Mycolicibacterium peregrinum]MCW1822281.1 thioredoxin family protein [Mycolicibacterium senegalense]